MTVFLVEDTRVGPLGNVFKTLGREGCEDFERVDPQFIALSKLLKVCGPPSVWLAALNGLITYMLTMHGEDFWTLFTEFAAGRCGGLRSLKDAVRLVSEFTSLHNRLSLEAKLRRLGRAALCGEAFEKLSFGDLRGYVSSISRCISVDEDSKTVVFSAKMAYYVLKSGGLEADVSGIPIPVDRRVALVTLTSGLVSSGRGLSATLEGLEGLAQNLMKHPNIVREAWDLVSRASGVPAMKMDAPLWLVGRYIKEGGVSTTNIVRSLRDSGITIENEVLTSLVSELTHALRRGQVF
ncbi:MAG: N-glycosylase/DNA lyase [Zestosphaera sp.]